MSENSQNLLQSANNEEQFISALGLIKLKTGSGKDIQPQLWISKQIKVEIKRGK